jgi:hypothetical protein
MLAVVVVAFILQTAQVVVAQVVVAQVEIMATRVQRERQILAVVVAVVVLTDLMFRLVPMAVQA